MAEVTIDQLSRVIHKCDLELGVSNDEKWEDLAAYEQDIYVQEARFYIEHEPKEFWPEEWLRYLGEYWTSGV